MFRSNKTKLRRSLFACCKRRAAPTQATCSTIRSTFSTFFKNNSFSFYMHLPVEDHFGLRELVVVGVGVLGIVLINDGATVV